MYLHSSYKPEYNFIDIPSMLFYDKWECINYFKNNNKCTHIIGIIPMWIVQLLFSVGFEIEFRIIILFVIVLRFS